MREKSVAVVTGASRRFGLMMCKTLLSRFEYVVALTRSSSNELEALVQEGLVILRCDQSDEASVTETVDKIKQQFKRIDLLVHNSSIFERDPEQQEEIASHISRHLMVHCNSVALLNFGLAPLMYDESEPGLIVHLSDIFAERPRPNFSLYCASKAALESFTKSLALKWAPGIRVMSLQPGPVKFLPEHSEAAVEAVLSETPLAREGGFEPLLNALIFILENDYLTGSAIKVDGGRSVF